MEVLKRAEATLGVRKIGVVCGVTYQAAKKWTIKGKLPRTEYTGETDYAARIAAACLEKDPQTQITREALLGLDICSTHESLPAVVSSEAGA